MNIKERIKQHHSNLLLLRCSISDFEQEHDDVYSITMHDDGYSIESHQVDARFDVRGKMTSNSIRRYFNSCGELDCEVSDEEWLSEIQNINKLFLEVEA